MEDFSSPEDEEWKKRRGVSKDKGRSDREAGSGTFLHWNLGGAPLSRAGHSTGAVTVSQVSICRWTDSKQYHSILSSYSIS